jgi:hypothetical protein
MQGACIYLNKLEKPVLLMYKEWNNSTIYMASYCEGELKTGYCNTKIFMELIPVNCEHILTSLPLDKSSEIITLNMWKSIVKAKLMILNNRDKHKL